METPYTHEQGGFKTVAHGKESACVNLLTISAVNLVLSDKRRADELSRKAAKERMRNSRKRKRTPNTTRGEDGIVIRKKLRKFDNEQAAEDKADKKKSLEKEIKDATKTLTEWTKLEAKRRQMAVQRHIQWSDDSLWRLTVVGSFTAEERKCILKLCVPNSGVLSKGEKEHVSIFVSKGVTLVSILAAIDVMRKQLTCSQKELDGINRLSAAPVPVGETVGPNATDERHLFNGEDMILIDEAIDDDIDDQLFEE